MSRESEEKVEEVSVLRTAKMECLLIMKTTVGGPMFGDTCVNIFAYATPVYTARWASYIAVHCFKSMNGCYHTHIHISM